jgi:cysteine-rich repeat protein
VYADTVSRLALVLALVAAGCIEAELVPCGTNVCSHDQVCTPGGCASAEDAAACQGKLDGDSCGDNRACALGICHDVVCGDGIDDVIEACDDSNTIAGDGCSALCDSTEECGNGAIDLIEGEECDDGRIGASNDGCSSVCKAERGVWRDVSPAPIAARSGHGLVYDIDRSRFVLFGGQTSDKTVSETWEYDYDAARWLRRITSAEPPERYLHAMIYAPDRRRIVMFGGTAMGVAYNDTWELDGVDWHKLSPAVSPPPRYRAPVAFDSVRGVVVLFGGIDALGIRLADTWEWDGSTWTARLPGATPPAAAIAGMTYDSNRRVTVLVTATEVWEYDGVTWTKRGSAPSPARTNSVVGFDGLNNAVILFGGQAVTGTSVLSDVWSWNGTDWTQLTPTTVPPARTASAAAPFNDAFVIFGGISSNGNLVNDIWIYNGANWLALPTAAVAPAERGTELVFDEARGVVRLFGGRGPYPTTYADTWSWDGANWRADTSLFTPTDRAFHSLVYDSLNARTVLIGGSRQTGNAGVVTDNWYYSGALWTPLDGELPPRYYAAAAFDRKRGRVVVFGGSTDSAIVGDHWELDGTTWIERTEATRPSPRIGGAMGYDDHRERIVLFGGLSVSGLLADTWEWDGASWMQLQPAIAPSPRYAARMVYDPVRRRVVMLGGASGQGDMWEWNGTSWTQVPIALPHQRSIAGAAYDRIARGIVLFGGLEAAGPANGDTWLFRYESLLADERCLSASADADGDELRGCDDPDCFARCDGCGDNVCAPIEDKLICPADCN